MLEFSEEELSRYSRHFLLKECGTEGQKRIRRGRVLIVGAGGLGSPAALYLAAAGVGTIGIVDGDVVDLSNLQRQVIHTTADVGRPKVESACESIRAINPHVVAEPIYGLITEDNAADIIGNYDFIIDATDNFAAKMLINDTCAAMGKPFSHGGIMRFEGHTFTWTPGSACYRCIFGGEPPTDIVPPAAEVGVFGAIAGMLGTIQAAEALKFLTGIGHLLTDSLLTFDATTMDFNRIRVSRNRSCAVCATDKPRP